MGDGDDALRRTGIPVPQPYSCARTIDGGAPGCQNLTISGQTARLEAACPHEQVRSLQARRATSGARWHLTLRMLRDYRAELTAFQVTPLQAATVLYLQHNPGSYIRHCANGVCVPTRSMREILERIEQRRWLRKQRVPEDDRYLLLTLTRTGPELASKVTRLLHVARTISTQCALGRNAAWTPGQ